MILKLMHDNPHGVATDDPRAACKFVDNVIEATVKTIGTGEQAVDVVYGAPNQGLTGETFVLANVAFLMNNNGKTIQMFLPHEKKVA